MRLWGSGLLDFLIMEVFLFFNLRREGNSLPPQENYRQSIKADFEGTQLHAHCAHSTGCALGTGGTQLHIHSPHPAGLVS